MNTCNCNNASPIVCLMGRYGIEHSLADCLNGCECRCHYLEGGALVYVGQWQENKRRVWRLNVRPDSDTITDPRIRALLKDEVQQ